MTFNSDDMKRAIELLRNRDNLAVDIARALQEERKRVLESLEDYICHSDRCILAQWQAGEPTEDGGYRTKYAGKWYQSRPIDETPKCNCGLQESLNKEVQK